MTLEFLMKSQAHQQVAGSMYRHPGNPSTQAYPWYNVNSQIPSTQYPSEYPPVTPAACQAAAGSSNSEIQTPQNLPPATNSWASGGFPTNPVMDWGPALSQDPTFAGGSFPGQTPGSMNAGSPYSSEDLDYFQGFASSATVSSVSQALHSQPAMRSSYHDWMRSTSYRVNPQTGKTRTKDKYRVVYTDHQRLELEKEFHYTRYITIRRKSELAGALGLSERQVKIWFQNRRAKERKQKKKEAAAAMTGCETSDKTREGALIDKEEETNTIELAKTAVKQEIVDPLGENTGEPEDRNGKTTPEVLETPRTTNYHQQQQPEQQQRQLNGHELAPQIYLMGTGGCQQRTVASSMPSSLLPTVHPMHLK